MCACVQEPEPCDPQARYETPTKKTAAPDEEITSPAVREPKREAKTKPEPEAKKEPKEEETEPEVVEAVVVKPKGQRGRKRKSAVLASPAVPSTEVKEDKIKEEKSDVAVVPVAEAAAAAAATVVSTIVKPEATTSRPVLVRTELKKVGIISCVLLSLPFFASGVATYAQDPTKKS